MTYTGLTNTDRVTAASTSFQNGELGLANQKTGTATTSFTRDPSGTLISDRIGGSSYYYVYDGLGSVVALVNASGTAVNTYSYDPYGNTRASTGTTLNPFQYTAGYNQGNGLYKFGARYYDPKTGRFTQQDPAGQQPNLYAYAGDSPINYWDPSGLSTSGALESCAVGAATGALISSETVAGTIFGAIGGCASGYSFYELNEFLGTDDSAGDIVDIIGDAFSEL